MEREYIGYGLVDFDPAAPSFGDPTTDRHDSITGVDELIRLHSELSPHLVPFGEHGPNALYPGAGLRIDVHELLPLDKERRVENEVWLAFTGRALVDPELRAHHDGVDEELRRACLGALEELGSGGRLRQGLDLELEAERLHGLLDGLALHTAMRPDRMSPRLIRSVLARRLDSLDPAENGR
jgi:AcrR family transcriptional regulator